VSPSQLVVPVVMPSAGTDTDAALADLLTARRAVRGVQVSS
jgi:hypothetical protein